MSATRSVRAGRTITDHVEGAAISASMLCLVHCLALPLLLLLVPGSLGLIVRSEAVHLLAIAIIAPTAVLAFGMGARLHGALGPLIMGAGGLACLVLALWPDLARAMSVAITVLGSVLLVAGHGLNWRMRHRAG